VWAAREVKEDGEKIAIKKIVNCFSQATEAKRILRELRILRHLSHPNVIRIRDVLEPTSEQTFSDLWVVFDFVDLDLRKLIASPQTISVAHVQWIAHQILAALQYLHSAHVLHRDLKPANVLLSGTCEVRFETVLPSYPRTRKNSGCATAIAPARPLRRSLLRVCLCASCPSCPGVAVAPAVRLCEELDCCRHLPPPQVKICDFGLARVVDEEAWDRNEATLHALTRQVSAGALNTLPKVTRQMTSHVVTRWYRAPELILLQRYTTAIDIWSFACIFAELLTMLPEVHSCRPPRLYSALLSLFTPPFLSSPLRHSLGR
jgi:serine/threonine protein kinase